jgi:hypothetical protein
MNMLFLRFSAMLAAVVVLGMTLCAAALAGPGEHGPGGEHINLAAAQTAGATQRPRIEAKSELFELVAYLLEGEISVMMNRFETNEPVLGASVEISSGSSRAVAKFRADHGDYAVDDPGFLKRLAAPGEHPLIFTIVAGNDSDLLEGTLKVAPTQAEAHSRAHSHWVEYLLIGAAALAAVIAGIVFWRRRARRRLGYVGGELS